MSRETPAQILWSLVPSGLGSTISGAGNSGNWSSANPAAETMIDLRFIDDLGLYVYVTGITSSPTLKVQLDGYDDQGNLFANLAATANITGAGAAAPVYVGKHGSQTGAFIVLPPWGRISWTCTGGTCTGVGICLIAR
jgi:hypothetical protein